MYRHVFPIRKNNSTYYQSILWLLFKNNIQACSKSEKKLSHTTVTSPKNALDKLTYLQ